MRRARTTDPRILSARAEDEAWQQLHGGNKTVRYVPLTPAGHTSMATQTDTATEYLPELPNEKGTMTLYDDGYMDAQKRFSAAMDMSGHPYNNFYQRMRVGPQHGPASPPPRRAPPSRRQSRPKSPPTFRSGNMGGSWRHVQQCTGALGNHICLIDGEVKSSDVKHFPPFGFVDAPDYNDEREYESPQYNGEPQYSYRPGRMSAPMRRHPDHAHSQRISVEESLPRGYKPAASTNGYPRRKTTYNNHARNNFRYWYDERPPGKPSRPARTIMGNMMKLGVGY